MKKSSKLLTMFPALVATTFAVGSAQGAVVLDSDFAGVVKAGNTGSDFTWDTVNGIETPATSMEFFDGIGDPRSFHNTRAGELDPIANIGNGETWVTSFVLDLDGSTSTISLTSLNLTINLLNGSGGLQDNTTGKDGLWTVSVEGTEGYNDSAFTILDYTMVEGQLVPIDLTSLAILDNSQSYTVTLSVMRDNGNFGHHVSLDDMTLNGDITPIPEPSAALLGGIGILALLRRRR